MDRSRQPQRFANDIAVAAEETHCSDVTTSGMEFQTVIRVAPGAWLCITNSQTAPPPCADHVRQVLALEPHLQERLHEVLDEIVRTHVECGSGHTACLADLTGRQRQIVDMVRHGASNKTIARQLGLSVGTVKVHMHRIFRALGITNRVQLATMPNLS
jgi:DNA-binding NarL/FixJ family response regulator